MARTPTRLSLSPSAWLAAALVVAVATDAAADSADPARVAHGAYVLAAAGCAFCHTDTKNAGAPLAGGRALDTPFGTFYTPNITADPDTGIGRWSDADFLRALREGIAPDGSYFYPAFPYPSYARASEQDLLDLKAYIFSLPPVKAANKPHELDFPFSWRALLAVWRLLNFDPQPLVADPARSAAWNRGAYLVESLGHCEECHTPRGVLGGLEYDRAFSGTAEGPEGGKIPNITPDPETGIGRWSAGQVARLLTDGALPDFDYVGSVMTEVVRDSTSRLTPEDRAAIAEYLLSRPPIRNPDAKATQP
jgi:mono/diheme cytochrome c family protein